MDTTTIIVGIVVFLIVVIVLVVAIAAISGSSAPAAPPPSSGGVYIPPPPSAPAPSSGTTPTPPTPPFGGTPTPAPAPPPAPKCTGNAYFYQDKNYGGKVMSLGKGYWNIDAIKARDFNDRISSWKIPASCKATMWEDKNRGGDVWRVPPLPAENPWVGDGINDEISEIEIADADS